MRVRDLIRVVSQKTGDAVLPLVDAIPPYYIAEGVLSAKEVGTSKRHFICVNGARVAVDRPTFETLSVGERIRVRYTRGSRAVSIDRYVSSNGHV